MQSVLSIILIFLTVYQSACTKQTQTPVATPSPAGFCMDQDCKMLDEMSYECSESRSEQACEQFLTIFEKLLNPYVCDGKVDPLLNINRCGQRPGAAYVDLHFKRLSELDDPKAIALYASEKFRKVLDGNSAEEHFAPSQKQAMILNPLLLPKGYIVECIEYERKLHSQEVIADMKQFKKAEFSRYQINDYQIALGQFGIYVTRNQKECHSPIEGEVRSEAMTKFKNFDVVKIISYGFEKQMETIVDLASCKVIWQAELFYESLEMNSSPESLKVKKVNLDISAFKKCRSCWNKNTRECKRF